MAKCNLLTRCTFCIMLRLERGVTHIPPEGEHGVSRSYSIIANAMALLWAPFFPYLFKGLLIWKEPSKEQLQGPGWHHQEKLAHWDHNEPVWVTILSPCVLWSWDGFLQNVRASTKSCRSTEVCKMQTFLHGPYAIYVAETIWIIN